MIANPTTLILGAGASCPIYPTGAELRRRIIEAAAIGIPELGERLNAELKRLSWRLRDSMIPSIDAFLAEEENKEFVEGGKYMIAHVLLPCERGAFPAWYHLVFNAIRRRTTGAKLRVVTFNYDLSLEYAIFKAFQAAYKLDGPAARAMMDEKVEFIHVYGQLGDVGMPSGQRSYGEDKPNTGDAKTGLKIIGRDPENELFSRAQEAIASAQFLAILGFGFDETNIANLKLVELGKDKAIFSTAYHMGYGMRAWIRHIGLKTILFGHRDHDVETFLVHSGFLHWANIPERTGHAMHGAILEQLRAGKYELPD